MRTYPGGFRIGSVCVSATRAEIPAWLRRRRCDDVAESTRQRAGFFQNASRPSRAPAAI